MEEKVLINYQNKAGFFRQTEDFIFLDEAVVVPGKVANGKKLVSSQDWYFKIHFPGDPVMPGVFQLEAVMQTGGLIINTIEGKKELKLMFGACKDVKIKRIVRPGDVLNTKAELTSYKRGVAWFQGSSYVNDEVSCIATFSLIVPSEVAMIMGGKHE